MTSPELETEKVHITLVDNVIFRVLIKENIELELIDLDLNYNFFKQHIPKEKVPFLIIFGKGSSSATGAAERFSENERFDLKKKEALVLGTLPHRIIGNFYLRLAKANHPTKIFSNETDAIKWLND